MPFPNSQYPSVIRGYDKRQSERLLNAAPDLLVACQSLLSAFEDRTNGYPEDELHDTPQNIMESARKAIAKAEGRGE